MAQTTFDSRFAAQAAPATMPRLRRFDPLGLVSGFRCYLRYNELSAMSDRQLAAQGLERTTIARAAMRDVLRGA